MDKRRFRVGHFTMSIVSSAVVAFMFSRPYTGFYFPVFGYVFLIEKKYCNVTKFSITLSYNIYVANLI